MKNPFNSWKLLTLLSSLIFAMSCWYLVYAAGFDNWKVPGGIWYELDKSEWNSLMDSIWAVPAWAVMAFNLSSCPTGWSKYEDLEDAVIMGKGRYDTLWSKDWENLVTLTEWNMPKHSHYVVYEALNDYSWKRNYKYAWPHEQKERPINSYASYERDDDGNERYTIEMMQWKSYSIEANAWRTSSVGSEYPSAVDVRWSHVFLLYCQKD